MNYLDEEYYRGQKIVEQIREKKKLFIITRDKLGKYTLWHENKKIATKNNPIDLYERMV
ncbi:MAG: hypothetical protein GX947_03095 [Tissierellia bacterium]|nr:hypothetical protein [Tissierellia bacterium]